MKPTYLRCSIWCIVGVGEAFVLWCLLGPGRISASIVGAAIALVSLPYLLAGSLAFLVRDRAFSCCALASSCCVVAYGTLAYYQAFFAAPVAESSLAFLFVPLAQSVGYVVLLLSFYAAWRVWRLVRPRAA